MSRAKITTEATLPKTVKNHGASDNRLHAAPVLVTYVNQKKFGITVTVSPKGIKVLVRVLVKASKPKTAKMTTTSIFFIEPLYQRKALHILLHTGNKALPQQKAMFYFFIQFLVCFFITIFLFVYLIVIL